MNKDYLEFPCPEKLNVFTLCLFLRAKMKKYHERTGIDPQISFYAVEGKIGEFFFLYKKTSSCPR